MSVGCVVEWLLWLFLIDLECLEWKWTTSRSLPISSSSCSSWHVHSFEMALWKVKNWDMFIHSVVWVPASSTWLSWGKLWKQGGFVIKFLLFAICYVFVNAGLTGRTGRRPGRRPGRKEGKGREGKRPREEDRITTKPRTQSGRIWDPSLILDGGRGGKLCNPSYFAFSCKLYFALLWIMNSHLRCSEWSFPT